MGGMTCGEPLGPIAWLSFSLLMSFRVCFPGSTGDLMSVAGEPNAAGGGLSRNQKGLEIGGHGVTSLCMISQVTLQPSPVKG